MAGIDDLAAMLIGTQDKPNFAESDPYLPIANIGQGLQNTIIQGRDNYSNKENLIGSLLTGLLTGGAMDYSTDYQNREKQAFNESAIAAYRNQPFEKPNVLSDKLFNTANDSAKLFRIQEKINTDNKIDLAAAQAALQNPFAKEDILATAEQLKNPQRKPIVIGKVADESPSGESEIPYYLRNNPPIAEKVDQPAMTDREKYRNLLIKFNGNEALATAAYKDEIEKPKKDFADLSSLRKEFQGEQAYKDYVTAAKTYPTFLKALADVNNPAADPEIAKMSVQMIEPGLSVNAGEVAAATASATIPGAWIPYIKSSIETGSRLPPEIRTGMISLAQRQYEKHEAMFSRARIGYDAIGKRAGLIRDGEHVDVLGNVIEDIAKFKPQSQVGPVSQPNEVASNKSPLAEIDQKALLADAQALSNAGKTKEEIAQALRLKYGRPTSPSGVPFG